MQKSAFERTGLVPRSIIRTFDRFRRQLLPGAEDLVIQEFRVSKYQVLVSVRCLASLLFFPLLVNYLVKTTILIPLAEYIWNTQQNEIFLNFYQENRAFLEMRDFEEKTFFESLVSVEPRQGDYDTLMWHKTQNNFDLIPVLEKVTSQNDIKNCNNKNITFNYTPNLKDSFLNLPKKRGPSKLLPTELKELNLNKIEFEKSNFLPKSKLCKASKFLLCKNKVSRSKTSNSSALHFVKQNVQNTFSLENRKKVTQDYHVEGPIFAATKNDFSFFEKNKDFAFNNKNKLLLSSQPKNFTKFDFLEQNLPITRLNYETKLCDFENKKVKGGVFLQNKKTNKIDDILLQKKFQEKTIQLATFYNQQTISAIANVFGDFVTLITIAFLFVLMKPQIIILKSFLTESIYSLSDTTKSFLLILLTDLLVGFHSPRGWEILIEILLRHFGLPENQDFVFLFVATLPVLLDTVFKYWIFRYLNQISPSTVATYHSMIE